MTICPAFWDAEWAEINRLLPRLPSEGEDPDPDLFDQWCNVADEDWAAITPNYRTFVTPGWSSSLSPAGILFLNQVY
jgi:hypothetical protein